MPFAPQRRPRAPLSDLRFPAKLVVSGACTNPKELGFCLSTRPASRPHPWFFHRTRCGVCLRRPPSSVEAHNDQTSRSSPRRSGSRSFVLTQLAQRVSTCVSGWETALQEAFGVEFIKAATLCAHGIDCVEAPTNENRYARNLSSLMIFASPQSVCFLGRLLHAICRFDMRKHR